MLLPTVFCERAECLSKDFINLATSGIANNIMVFRVQTATGITALVSIQKRVDLGLILQPM